MHYTVLSTHGDIDTHCSPNSSSDLSRKVARFSLFIPIFNLYGVVGII